MIFEHGKYYMTSLGQYDMYVIYTLDNEAHFGAKVFDYNINNMSNSSFRVITLSDTDKKREWVELTKATRILQINRKMERYFCNSLLLIKERSSTAESYAIKYLPLTPNTVRKNTLEMYFEES